MSVCERVREKRTTQNADVHNGGGSSERGKEQRETGKVQRIAQHGLRGEGGARPGGRRRERESECKRPKASGFTGIESCNKVLRT